MSVTSRREQFNISALKFSDEVHDLIAELSRTRRLSDWIAKHAAAEIKRNGSLAGEQVACVGDVNIMKELQEIKQLLQQGACNFREPLEVEVIEQKSVIQKISSDQLVNTIDEDDLNYNF